MGEFFRVGSVSYHSRRNIFGSPCFSRQTARKGREDEESYLLMFQSVPQLREERVFFFNLARSKRATDGVHKAEWRHEVGVDRKLLKSAIGSSSLRVSRPRQGKRRQLRKFRLSNSISLWSTRCPISESSEPHRSTVSDSGHRSCFCHHVIDTGQNSRRTHSRWSVKNERYRRKIDPARMTTEPVPAFSHDYH